MSSFSEWVEHFLLDNVEVMQSENNPSYYYWVVITDHNVFHRSVIFDTPRELVECYALARQIISMDDQCYKRPDPRYFKSAEKAWFGALYYYKENPRKLAYAEQMAHQAIAWNKKQNWKKKNSHAQTKNR